MIFVDTSAIYALADVADPNHTIAVERFSRLVREGFSSPPLVQLHCLNPSNNRAYNSRLLGSPQIGII